MKLPIYLDYSATTPVDPRVVQKMIPFLTEHFGNPASRSHAFGWEAEAAVEEARGHIADLVNCDPKEIVWTSGATESINLALKGAAHFYKDKGKHLITVKTEHKASSTRCASSSARDSRSATSTSRPTGCSTSSASRRRCVPTRSVVSVMLVNNEIGVIQDIRRDRRDLPLAWNHLPRRRRPGHRQAADRPRHLKVDLMSFSAHKTYGPKGMGALFVRRKPRVRIEAQMHGGGHERGMRSGTLPTHQIVGMGEAFRLASWRWPRRTIASACCATACGAACRRSRRSTSTATWTGACRTTSTSASTSSRARALIMAIKDVAVSSGSACTSASLEPSYVLRALGRSDELAHSSIRFTVGRFTTEEEIDLHGGAGASARSRSCASCRRSGKCTRKAST